MSNIFWVMLGRERSQVRDGDLKNLCLGRALEWRNLGTRTGIQQLLVNCETIFLLTGSAGTAGDRGGARRKVSSQPQTAYSQCTPLDCEWKLKGGKCHLSTGRSHTAKNVTPESLSNFIRWKWVYFVYSLMLCPPVAKKTTQLKDHLQEKQYEKKCFMHSQLAGFYSYF